MNTDSVYEKDNGSNYVILRANEINFTWARFLSEPFIHSEYRKIMASTLLW